MRPLSQCRLYTFVDAAYMNGRDPALLGRQLCEGGADLIQLRAKLSPPDEIRRMAEVLRPITEQAGVGLVINDHISIARETGADLCHLGQEDFFEAGNTEVAALRPLRIGLSTHAPEQAHRAIVAGADYIAIGPVYATGTKPGVKPVTLDYVRWASANVQIPWFAIGGITLQNVDEVVAAGARRICVVSAILNSNDVVDACRQFKKHL